MIQMVQAVCFGYTIPMEIHETTFGPKTYLTIPRSIPISQVTDKEMYSEAGKKLAAYVQANGLKISGPFTVMYFSWDEKEGRTDLGIGLPIADIDEVTDISYRAVTVPASKAAMCTLSGSYEGLGEAHRALGKYAAEKELDTEDCVVMSLEEYAVGPMTGSPESDWKTDLYYFHN